MSDSASTEETIFIGARQLSAPGERAAYLDQACGDNPALRERVERMLNAEQKADQFLASDPLQVDKTALATFDGSEAVGSMIGRYKLLQQIGEGGCGIVYMAEQEQPIRRRVALKVIKPGMDTKQVIARFEAERQAVSMMDHPNIARVLDAGATEAGRPYFVMELVRGIRITDYCDQNNLATRERLDLFMKVVQAVQHAHQKGIIHRDIKPSNVLITLHDGVPVPKVIDFGIAKALEQKLTDKTLFTQFEQFIGTPAYTSPEQAEMSGLDIDTRSDIYSLGVLLYELLVGKTPFEAKELMHSGLDEMRRMIREQEPMRPSTKLSQTLGAADVRRLQSPSSDRPATEEEIRASSRRLLQIKETIALLRGDLDWIVMKCLEKDRTRRYDTANRLCDDIEHYLGNEPVSARPPSRVYRFGKLVRRNKLAFAATAAVVTALVAGIAVSTWQATRARQAEKAAQAEKDSAEAVLKFFRDKVMAAGRPEGQGGGLGKDVTLRRAIDAAESQIAEAFKDRPLVEAAIRKTLGDSYRYLGEPASGVQQLERAMELYRQSLGLLHDSTIITLESLQKAYGAAGITNKALPLYEECLKLLKAKHGPEHPDTLRAMNNLAWAYQVARKYDQAATLLEETLELRKATRKPNDGETLATMNDLALAYQAVGKVDQAVTLFEETFQVHKAKRGADHFETLTTMENLVDAYQTAGKVDQSLALAQEWFKIAKAKWGPKHPSTLRTMHYLGSALARAGKHEQAVLLFEETLKLRKDILGPEHPDTLGTVSQLVDAYRQAGKNAQSLSHAEELFKVRKARLGPEHSETLRAGYKLAVAYQNVEEHEQALRLFEELLKLQTAKRGPDHRDTLSSMTDLAGAYWAVGKHDQAAQLDEQTFKLRKAKLGPEHPDTLWSMHYLADDYREMGKFDQAEALYRENLGLKRDSLTATLGLTRVLLKSAGSDTNNPARAQAQTREADELLRDYLAKARLHYTNDAAKLEGSLYEVAELRYRQRQYAEAELLYREAVRSRHARLPAEHKDVVSVTASLGRLLADWAWAERDAKSEIRNPKSEIAGRAREAERLLRECLGKHLRGANQTHWRVGDTKSRLGGALVSVAVTDPELNAAAREVKLAEAETLLLEGNQRLQETQSATKKYQRDALERLARLYEAWGKPEQRSDWQQKLDAFNQAKTQSAAPAEQGSR